MNIDRHHVAIRDPWKQGPESAGPEDYVIWCQQVSKSYPDEPDPVVENLTFRVYDVPGEGELIGLLGPNGCGCSTILKLLAGLTRPTSGTLLERGLPVRRAGREQALVGRDPALLVHRTVLENVAFGLIVAEMNRKDRLLHRKLLDPIFGVQGPRKHRIMEVAGQWLDRVGLRDRAGQPASELTPGEACRVALARSLAVKPRLLLLDDPFGGLDRSTRWGLQDLILGLWRQSHATIIIASRDIAEVVYLAGRVFILSERPATIEDEIDVPAPDEPAAQMQRSSAFADVVNEISLRVERPRQAP